jgi:hypothetical protein
VLAGLRRRWRRTLVYVEVVGGALLLASALGAFRAADGDRAVLVLAGIGAAVGVVLLAGAARRGR